LHNEIHVQVPNNIVLGVDHHEILVCVLRALDGPCEKKIGQFVEEVLFVDVFFGEPLRLGERRGLVVTQEFVSHKIIIHHFYILILGYVLFSKSD